MSQCNGICLAMLAMLSSHASATVFCARNGNELRNALITAGSNGQDDQINLVNAIFEVNSGTTAFSYSTSENFSVAILGGYTLLPNGSCGDGPHTPSQTLLNGEGVRQVLSVKSSAIGAGSNMAVGNLAIRNANSNLQGAALSMGGPAGYAGRVSVFSVIFVNNTSSTAIGGLAIVADLGRVSVVNNLFIENRCQLDYCAFDVISNAPSTAQNPIGVEFGFNTVADNACLAGAPASCDVPGGRFYGDAHAAFFNNAFAFNDGADLRLQGPNVDLDHNNIPLWIGTPATDVGNLALINPLLVGAGNYRLRSDSPLLNAGVIGPYSIPGQDLDGRYRNYGPEVDIGAYENHVAIFGNGFDTPY